MSTTKRVKYINNFNYDEFYDWCKRNSVKIGELTNEMGYNSSFFANSRARNALLISAYNYIILRFKLADGSFLLKHEENESLANNNHNNDDVFKEIVELHNSVNRIGNILMQLLEYASEMRKEREVNDRR